MLFHHPQILTAFVLVLASSLAQAEGDTKEAAIRQELRAIANGHVIADWQKQVGATTQPPGTHEFKVDAQGDGQTLCTDKIQKAIDDCSAAGGGIVDFAPGSYVTGSLFVKSNVHLRIDKAVTLLGSTNDDDWPKVHTRAAGIETEWRAALINVRDQQNVSITGKGTLDARGRHFWQEFFDALSDYSKRGLRWAVDYDISRPHLLQVYQSRDVTIQGLTLQNSPFWTVHVVFSKNVTVDHITIQNNLEGKGPSTDGINIDSSAFCVVSNCDVDNNDDNYSFKSGINADGLRVNLPVQYTVFHDNISRRGHGLMTLGSDMSGGIHHVEAYNLEAFGTAVGIRFKSARVRGGDVSDIYIHDVKLHGVGKAILADLNWFPSFSYPKIPDTEKIIPPVWKILSAPNPKGTPLPHFHNITLANIEATKSGGGLSIEGLPNSPLENVTLRNIKMQTDKAGSISNAKNWTFTDVIISGKDGKPITVKDSENVSPPSRQHSP